MTKVQDVYFGPLHAGVKLLHRDRHSRRKLASVEAHKEARVARTNWASRADFSDPADLSRGANSLPLELTIWIYSWSVRTYSRSPRTERVDNRPLRAESAN